MIDLLTRPAIQEPAPRPWPDRDWLGIKSTLLDKGTIESMTEDSLHRDIHSTAKRVEAWEIVNEHHMWAREHNPGLPPDTGIYLFSAPMGHGKSHLMLAYAMLAWMFRAVPVFSSESVGALFGYQLRLEEVYNFSDVLPKGSILLVDELAALADSQSGKANRGRILHGGLTSFRKGGNLALTATASEWSISNQLKIAMQAIIEPARVYPRKRVVTGYDYLGRPKYATFAMREHELDYPRFCYLKASGLLEPWVGKRAHEDYRAALYESRRAKRRSGRGLDPRWRPSGVLVPTPFYMDLASKLYDTHKRVPTSDPYSLDAGAMRAATDRMSNRATIPGFIDWLHQNEVLRQYAGKKRITLAALHEVAGVYHEAYREMSRAHFGKEVAATIGDRHVSDRQVMMEGLAVGRGRGRKRA